MTTVAISRQRRSCGYRFDPDSACLGSGDFDGSFRPSRLARGSKVATYGRPWAVS
jgi:hypothetical protein